MNDQERAEYAQFGPYGGDDAQGLYRYGPRGPFCVLAILLAYSFCAITESATPDGERRQRVDGKAKDSLRAARRWRDDFACDPYDDDAEYYALVLEIAGEPVERRSRVSWNGGRYNRPVRPANSGRRKKAA